MFYTFFYEIICPPSPQINTVEPVMSHQQTLAFYGQGELIRQKLSRLTKAQIGLWGSISRCHFGDDVHS